MLAVCYGALIVDLEDEQGEAVDLYHLRHRPNGIRTVNLESRKRAMLHVLEVQAALSERDRRAVMILA